MSITAQPLEEMIQKLSPHLRNEVQIFVESLLNKSTQIPKQKLRQDWAGSLKADNYTALELQHLASEWRNV
ncbi:DUF2281 domain-containing protein [Pseudanabaena biceps]|nr:DUF2281 domain-containing protein [Pseudanabaena biceps]